MKNKYFIEKKIDGPEKSKSWGIYIVKAFGVQAWYV